MNDLLTILIISLLMGAFFTYKVVKGIISHMDFKNGTMIKAKVIKTEWIKAPIIKFSYLFPDKQLRILYHFTLDGNTYEKEDDDIHFMYKRYGPNLIPKENDEINVFVPKSKNPNKVTFNKSYNTIKPIIGFAFLAILSFSITSLIIYNWNR